MSPNARVGSVGLHIDDRYHAKIWQNFKKTSKYATKRCSKSSKNPKSTQYENYVIKRWQKTQLHRGQETSASKIGTRN